jgi:hypothetical protein
MTKAMHSTTSRRQTSAGTATRRPAETENAPAPSHFIDPATLLDEYAMRVRGDCLAPAIRAATPFWSTSGSPTARAIWSACSSSPNAPGAVPMSS